MLAALLASCEGHMHRIEHSTKATNKHGTGKHGYTGGVVPATPATRPQASEFDSLQESLMHVIEDGAGLGGLTVATDNYRLFLHAIRVIQQRALIAQLLSEFEEVDLGSSAITHYAIISYQRREAGNNGGKVVVVAVGSGGQIEASEDGGDTFATATVGPTGILRALAVGGGYFCAVGDSGNVSVAQVTAATGTWTAKTVTSAAYKGVAHYAPLDEFIAVGAGATINRGKLANPWTDLTGAITGWVDTLNAVASHGSTVMIAGDEGLARSADGVTFAEVYATTGGAVKDVYYAEGLWFAFDSQDGFLYSADDGLTWSIAATVNTTLWPGNTADYNRALIVAGGLFITYQSEQSISALGVRLFTQELATSPVVNVPWRTAADPLELGHPFHFNPQTGQFWLLTGAQDKAYRSKKAPGAFERYLELPHYVAQ